MTVKSFIKPTGKKGLALIAIKYIHKSEWTIFTTGHSIKPEYFKHEYVTDGCADYIEINAKINKIKSDLLSVAKFLSTKHIDPSPAQVKIHYSLDMPFIGTLPANNAVAIKRELEEKQRQIDKFTEKLQKTQSVGEWGVPVDDNGSVVAEFYTPTNKEAQEKWDTNAFEKEWQERKDHQLATSSDIFFYYLDKYISENKNIKESTQRQYKSLRNILYEFKTETGFELSFANMNNKFYDSFAHWQLFEKGNFNNVFGARIKQLKSFLNYVNDKWHDEINIQINPAYKKFKKLSEEKDIVTLTPEEIQQLYAFPFDETLIKYRDIFVFGCETGLRFSDLMRLRKQHIKDGGIAMKSLKTKKTFFVPLSDMAKEIIEKYNYNLSIVSEQKFNDNIKICCEQIGMDEIITTYHYKLKKEYQFDFKKFELISSHSARRSFCCNKLSIGYNESEVMSMTGHTSYKEFQKYVKITSKVLLEKHRLVNSEKEKEKGQATAKKQTAQSIAQKDGVLLNSKPQYVPQPDGRIILVTNT